MGPQSRYNTHKVLEKAHTKKENIMERTIDEILDEVFALVFGKDW